MFHLPETGSAGKMNAENPIRLPQLSNTRLYVSLDRCLLNVSPRADAAANARRDDLKHRLISVQDRIAALWLMDGHGQQNHQRCRAIQETRVQWPDMQLEFERFVTAPEEFHWLQR